MPAKMHKAKFARHFLLAAFCVAVSTGFTVAQNPTPSTDTLKKANTRPADPKPAQTDPFDGASVEKMTGQCVTLDTESGLIVIEMLPKAAPETARSFLNLAASGALERSREVALDYAAKARDALVGKRHRKELDALVTAVLERRS